jgi:hypothetical protein
LNHKPLLILFILMLSLPAMGDNFPIFSDCGPGNSYDGNNAYVVAGAGALGDTILTANAFTSSGDYAVTQIDLGLTWVTGTNGAIVSLWTENGTVPGAELGSWAVFDLPPFGSTSDQVVTISGIIGIELAAGTTYFLVVAPADSSTWDAWNWNITGATGLVDQQIDGVWSVYPGSTLSAFDVLASTGTTPEPSALILLGTGVFAILRRVRNKR